MDTDEAVRRVSLIAPMLREDVQTAIVSHAVLEASNAILPKGLSGITTPFVETYNGVQYALTMKLAMDLARIFDLSESKRFPPEEQDKASIPVLAALMSRPDVRNALENEAAEWLPGVEYIGASNAIPADVLEGILKSVEDDHRAGDRASFQNASASFLVIAGRLAVDGSDEKAALVRIREFRNKRLAHSLFDKEPDELPKYSDLHLLLDIAKEAAKYALLAVEGLNTEFDDQARRDHEKAEGYAKCVLDGLKRAASLPTPTAHK
ncbi:hypothetical protein FHT98_1805 [Bosea sp. AK1]|uniref:AbiU2 domain-containing protein n=1 Tax=Bosea sp. AK1 TaxID=2587160 RepID=UPI00114E0ED4|nr:hypothetical protein [Bosea sp. AK1]TQI74064.1 hypothetical protein FHT98_1805 [Bosea sp. AK1]